MKRIITNLFTFVFVVMFASACSSDDDFVNSESMQSDKDSVLTTRAVSYPYYLQFDIFTDRGWEDYYTFLVSNADNYAIGDTDPFPFYYYDDDITQPRTVADYSQIHLYDGDSRIEFDDRGLGSSFPYYYDIENGVGYHNVVKIGERVAIWASKERYTFEDLRAHAGDEEYFAKVSESFELYYITELKPHTYIYYGFWEPEWQSSGY
ncbi:MAG: hypothetical protein J6K19_01905 [Prevotella sp.]|nr:hypothetical protein [Prevotella sp.]